MYRKHCFESKLNSVSKIKNGVSLLELSRTDNIDRKLLLEWVRKYDLYGEEGLKKQSKTRATGKLKEESVRSVLEELIPLPLVALEHGVSRSALQAWVRLVKREGYISLYQENKRGRPPSKMRQSKKTAPKTELGKLQAENEYLRAENALLKKSQSLSRRTRSPRTHDWAQAIEELRQEHRLPILLECKQMAHSVFYYHRKRFSAEDKYKQEKIDILHIYHSHKGRYGYRRITDEMKNLGYTINHKTIQKLMGVLGLKSTIRKVRYRSYKGTVGTVAPNVIDRDFKASLPNQKWATDITQINIKEERLYFSPILDMFNGEIISYSISKSPNMKLIRDMLDKAFKKVKDTKGLIFHSDQGWQYQHYGYRTALQKHGIIQSMSRKGNCLDNAMAENFFGIMKSELLYAEKFDSSNQFIKSLEEYIYYYNNKRNKIKIKRKEPGAIPSSFEYNIINNLSNFWGSLHT